MVIKLYISGISGNKEVKKKQQRVQMILDSKQISYEAIDITEPGKEKDKEFMQQNGKVRESLGKYPLPPQIFNDEDFCGDYEDFDMANEVDELEKFLHIELPKEVENGTKQNEDSKSLNSNSSWGKFSDCSYDPYDYHTYKIKWDSVNGLQEEIISTGVPNDEGEKVVEEIVKSEINGELEAVPSSEQSEPVVEKTDDVPDSVKEEEVSAEEKEPEKEKEEENEEEKENVGEKEENDNEEGEKEEEEKEKEEEIKNTEEEESEVEKPKEEETPHEEEAENEESVDNENKEKESENEKEESEKEEEEEKEEAENDNKSESAESEKSEEE